MFDPAGAGELSRGTPRCDVGFPEQDGGRVLRLRYRTDVLDAACATRIAGFQLHRARADPRRTRTPSTGQAEPVVEPDELQLQLDGFAGPTRGGCRPGGRMSCSSTRSRRTGMRSRPCRATGGGHYRDSMPGQTECPGLCAARGLRREGVVAVVTERDLDWMASVIAGLQGRRRVPAGRAALPGRPHRRRPLSRAACRLVLTEPGSTATLTQRSGRTARCAEASRRGQPAVRATPTPISGSPLAGGTSSPTSTGAQAPPASSKAPCARARRTCSTVLRGQDRGPGDRPGAGGGPDRARMFRHLALAAVLRTAGGRADPARRAGGRCWTSSGSSTSSTRAG